MLGLRNYLENPALQVYRTYLERNKDADYDLVARHLKSEFDGLDPKEQCKSFLHRKQEDSEQVYDFAREMELMMSTEPMSDKVKVGLFINGLQPSIGNVLRGLDIKTMKEA